MDRILNELNICYESSIRSKSKNMKDLKLILSHYQVLETDLNDSERKLIKSIFDTNLKKQDISKICQYFEFISPLHTYINNHLNESEDENLTKLLWGINFVVFFAPALFDLLTWKECIELYDFLKYDYYIPRDVFFYLWVGDKYFDSYEKEKGFKEFLDKKDGFIYYDMFYLVNKYFKDSKFDKIKECMASTVFLRLFKNYIERSLLFTKSLPKSDKTCYFLNIYNQIPNPNFSIYDIPLADEHNFIIELRKTSQDTYSLSYYNSGSGLEFFHSSIKRNGKEYFNLVQKYDNVPKTFVEKIFSVDYDKRKNVKDFYPPENFKVNSGSKYSSSQYSGTCSARMYNAFASSNLTGYDHTEFKIKLTSIMLRLVAEKYSIFKFKNIEIMELILEIYSSYMVKKIIKLKIPTLESKAVEPLAKAFVEPLLGKTNLNEFFANEFQRIRDDFISRLSENGYDTEKFQFIEFIKRTDQIYYYEKDIFKLLKNASFTNGRIIYMIPILISILVFVLVGYILFRKMQNKI